jgi:hypothetical protein
MTILIMRISAILLLIKDMTPMRLGIALRVLGRSQLFLTGRIEKAKRRFTACDIKPEISLREFLEE